MSSVYMNFTSWIFWPSFPPCRYVLTLVKRLDSFRIFGFSVGKAHIYASKIHCCSGVHVLMFVVLPFFVRWPLRLRRQLVYVACSKID